MEMEIAYVIFMIGFAVVFGAIAIVLGWNDNNDLFQRRRKRMNPANRPQADQYSDAS
jgi:hypothetical protein